MNSSRSRLAGIFPVVVAIVVLAMVVGAGALGVGYLTDRALGGGCTATVEGTEVRLDDEQARNAATVAAISVRRGLPARAASIALATAYQESKIRNVDYGDRDSLGLFQQRPSQGWGTPAQVMDPLYASNAFYAALERVDEYLTLPIDVAAQEVQRSADGTAYRQHEPNARALASALTGHSPHAFSCDVDAAAATDEAITDTGLTPTAQQLRTRVAAVFGTLPQGGFAPGGVTTGHSEGSAHYEGRAVDYFFRPVTETNTQRGWALAHFLVAWAEELSVATVIFDDKIWTARRSGEGWRDYDEDSRSGNSTVLRHLDHVHVDVA
jgi:hypothetical protein